MLSLLFPSTSVFSCLFLNGVAASFPCAAAVLDSSAPECTAVPLQLQFHELAFCH